MAARRSRWEASRRAQDSGEEADDPSDVPGPPKLPKSTPEQSPEQTQTSSEDERSSGEDESEESERGASTSGDEREASSAEESGRRESPGSEKGDKSPESPKNETAVVSQDTDQVTAGGPGVNVFANDGSFLELFKRKMEAAQNPQTPPGAPMAPAAPPEEQEKKRPSTLSFVGKRRGGTKLALKTGIVAKKQKTDEDELSSTKGGAWAQYMAEVKKYKAHQCSDDDKTRPLVK